MSGRIISALLLAILFFSFTGGAVEGTGNVSMETASMNVERAYHTATLLEDGKVLVVGGMRNSSNGYVGTDSCELYDPTSDSWSVTGSLHQNRYGHTATLLNDGRVLVAGGMRSDQQGIASTCELYDPATGSWNLTNSLNVLRYFHTASLLPDGKVLIVGGDNESSKVLRCEIYDPTTGIWTLTGALHEGIRSATSVLLPNGMVLVAGGLIGSSATSTCELYDPSTGTWRYTKPLNVARAWMEYGATLLQNGSFLVAGGGDGFNSLASCELYDPYTETWTLTGSLYYAAWGTTAILLPNGQVLDVDWSCYLIYSPGTGAWSFLTQTSSNRVAYTAILLTDGRVLVAGGLVPEPTASCELFTMSTAIPEFPSFSMMLLLSALTVGVAMVAISRRIRPGVVRSALSAIWEDHIV